jgi:hypothetical protein
VIGKLGGTPVAPAGGGAVAEDAGALEALGPALGELADLDGVDARAPLGGVELPRPLEAALAAPSAGALAGQLELGRAAAALARVVRRGARPDETPREKRLRELCARYLDLMQEAASGLGRITLG